MLDTNGVADLLGVKPATVRNWRSRELMPDADEVVGRSPRWHRRTVEDWARQTDRWPRALQHWRKKQRGLA